MASFFDLKSSDSFSYLYQAQRGEVALNFRYSPRDDLYFMDIVAGEIFLATNLPVLPGKTYRVPTFARLLGYNIFVLFYPTGSLKAYDKSKRAAEQVSAVVSEE